MCKDMDKPASKLCVTILYTFGYDVLIKILNGLSGRKTNATTLACLINYEMKDLYETYEMTQHVAPDYHSIRSLTRNEFIQRNLYIDQCVRIKNFCSKYMSESVYPINNFLIVIYRENIY